jgi:hypothetical protein
MRQDEVIIPPKHQVIIDGYKAGAKQAELAATCGLTQVRISQILRKYGVSARSNQELNPITFDVDYAEFLYSTGLSGSAVGEVLGISSGVVLTHLRRRGVTRPTGGVRKYALDEAFFSTVDPVRAYWAGFLAADGCVYKNRVVIGLHPQDEDMLLKLCRAARLQNPIAKRRNSSGHEYVYLEVSCSQWVRDLLVHYKITPHKSQTLEPPDLLTEELRWAYVRGYFDGDGHAPISGDLVQITCGSEVFLAWVIREVFGAPHKIYPNNGSWGCYVTGPVARAVIPKLYAGSTPETRMARKYDRLLAHVASDGFQPSPDDVG